MYVINITAVRDVVSRRSCVEGKDIDITKITDVQKFLNTRARDMGIHVVGHRPMAWHVIWLLKDHLYATKKGGWDDPDVQAARQVAHDLFVVQPDNTLFPEQMARVLRLLTKVGWLTKDRRQRTLTILPEDLAKAERLRRNPGPGYRTSKSCVVACAASRQWKKKLGCSFTNIYVDGPKGTIQWQDTSNTMATITQAFDCHEPLPPLPIALTFRKA